MFIPVTHGRLEARLHRPTQTAIRPTQTPIAAAVFCHPHPLHGGSMNTRAVFRIALALAGCGIATLRFNFRGVGASTGSFDDGIGELVDAKAAIAWVRERYPSLNLVVGGFSFGSEVGMRAGVEEARTAVLFGAGIPVDGRSYDFADVAAAKLPVFVVQGENDEFGCPARVRGVFEALGGTPTVMQIDQSDHLFTGKTKPLQAAVRAYFGSPATMQLLGATGRSAGSKCRTACSLPPM